MFQDVETAATMVYRRAGSLARFVAAGRRLLKNDPCDRCGKAPATIANGRGTAWCAKCSDLALAERRAQLDQVAELRRQIDLAREYDGR